jgi:hypothetical protein
MRDLNTGIVTPAPVIVDEQAKAAAMRAAAAAAPAAAAQIAKTPDQLLLEKAQGMIVDKKAQLADLYVSQGLNPDGSKKTNTQILQEKQTATAAARATAVAADPLLNKSVQPSAPAGYKYTWIGGTDTGSWQLYKLADPVASASLGGAGAGGSGNGSATAATITPTSIASTPSPVASLAIDTFKGTLALFFGQGEMSQPWVNELYNLVNPLYKTGSSVDEAFNLALQQGRNNPNLKAFTDRFQGIYALQDKLVAGQAVLVPTIAQYTAAEAGMGNVLRQAGLGDIATQQYLGTVIGKGLSVTDVGNYINNIYNEIQNLPQDIKDSVMLHYPGLDNVSLAKSILTGDKGFAQLQKELTAQEIQGVSAKQGLGTYNPITGKYSGISDAQSFDLTGQGFNMATAQPGLARAALIAPTVESLSNITAGATPMTQADIVNATVGGLASQQRKIDLLAQAEANRFQASSGNAPGAFSTGYLKRTSVAGQI